MVIKNWKTQKNSASVYIFTALLLLGGIFLFLFAASSPTAAFEVFPNLPWVFGFIVFIAIFFLYQAREAHLHRNFEFMIVGVESEKTVKVVENALNRKNFPYIRSGAGFRLKAEGLLIVVKKPSLMNNHSHRQESSIWIGPISKDNFEITQSLKTNIEDGFQLKGFT